MNKIKVSGTQEDSLSHNAPQGTYIPLGAYPQRYMVITVYKDIPLHTFNCAYQKMCSIISFYKDFRCGKYSREAFYE